MIRHDLSTLAPALFLILCLAIAASCVFSMREASRIADVSARLLAIIFLQVTMGWVVLSNYRAGVHSAIVIAIAFEILIILLGAETVADFRKRYPTGIMNVGLCLFSIGLAMLAGLAYAGWAAINYVETRAAMQLSVAVCGTLLLVSCAGFAVRTCIRQRAPIA